MGLGDGEELPADHEELTEAQYAAFRFARVLAGAVDEDGQKKLEAEASDRPSGIIAPTGRLDG